MLELGMAPKGKRAGGAKAKQRNPVALRLAMTRVALGFENQADFAKRANLSQNRYNQYETGERRITIDAAMKLKKAFGISLDWIYDGDRNGLPHAVWSALPADLTKVS
jgi:transcriptional regulator with XRE-family HTH domain